MSLKEAKKVDTNRYQLEIIIDGATFSEAISTVYKEKGKDINIPGFRKGKAPLHLVEKFYGESVFFEDALNLLYSDALEAAAEEAPAEEAPAEEKSQDELLAAIQQATEALQEATEALQEAKEATEEKAE